MPDDPFITEMDPVQRLWMFYSWVEDKKELQENYKNHAYLIGSFSNPEMVKKIIDADTIDTNDEDYEKSLEIVKQARKNMEKEASLKKRKRRKKIGT